MNRIWLLATALPLAAGCYIDLGEQSSGGDSAGTGAPVFAFDGGEDGEPLAVRNSTLAGDMGPVRGFADGIWLEHGGQADRWAWVEIQAADRGAGWAAMSRVQVTGGLELLEPGLTRTFEGGAFAEPGFVEEPGGEPTLFVDVVGCSGEMPGEWEFDLPAEQVEVQVDEGSEAGWVEVRFEATFRGFDVPETQVVTGSFEVERPERGTTDL